MALSKKQKIAVFLTGVTISFLFFAGIGMGESFTGSDFYITSGNIHHNATEGPEVTQTKDYNLSSGNPYTKKSYNLSTEKHGHINVSTSDSDSSSMDIQIDEINGTWTNTSSITADSGNITLNPSDKNKTIVGGGITAWKFNETKVNDGRSDAIITGTGTGTAVFFTNASPDTQYGLVDVDTNEGIDVAIAQSDGSIHFTEVDLSTKTVRIDNLGKLVIRNESVPHGKVKGCNAEVKFFETEDDNPTIQNATDADGDGEIDMTGLPVDEQFVANVKCAGYHNRTVVIQDLSDQETVFMLDKENTTSHKTTFVVTDRTGDFGDDSELVVQRAINRSLYGGSPSGFAWVNVAGDELGTIREYETRLQHEIRYRIKIQNDEGKTSILGSYTPTEEKTVSMTVESAGIELQNGTRDFDYGAEITDGGDFVFKFNDSKSLTGDIDLVVYEANNASNEFVNTTLGGPHGDTTFTKSMTSDQQDKSWIVKFSATRDGEQISAEFPIGISQEDIFPSIPTIFLHIAGFTFAILPALLLGGARAEVGAIGSMIAAGIAWRFNALPADVGILAITFALMIAVGWQLRKREVGSIQ